MPSLCFVPEQSDGSYHVQFHRGICVRSQKESVVFLQQTQGDRKRQRKTLSLFKKKHWFSTAVVSKSYMTLSKQRKIAHKSPSTWVFTEAKTQTWKSKAKHSSMQKTNTCPCRFPLRNHVQLGTDIRFEPCFCGVPFLCVVPNSRPASTCTQNQGRVQISDTLASEHTSPGRTK